MKRKPLRQNGSLRLAIGTAPGKIPTGVKENFRMRPITRMQVVAALQKHYGINRNGEQMKKKPTLGDTLGKVQKELRRSVRESPHPDQGRTTSRVGQVRPKGSKTERKNPLMDATTFALHQTGRWKEM